MKLSSVIGISLVMAALGAAIPPVNAHTCASTWLSPPLCGPCAVGENHQHLDIYANGSYMQCSSSRSGHPDCPAEPVHTYGSGSSVGGRSATATGGNDTGVGFVTVTDTNEADCNGDGIVGDWDGDYDAGTGGGAFGWGPWANEPTCNNQFNVHGPNVVVNDIIPNYPISFVVGEDDQAGPVIIPVDEDADGVPEGYICETSGSITPGDPATDPTADADDCLSGQYTTTGATCGSGGGDGLFWVFLDGLFVDENGAGTTVKNPPTTGTITAF